MAEDQKTFEFKRTVRKLSEFRGSGTELISVYIPAGAQVHEMGGKLREEMSQASNIKSKSTRLNVTGALERIIQHLKIFRETPPNGLAVFCGNVSDNPAKTDIELFWLEPIQKLSIGTYRCDSRFFLDPLTSMMDSKESFGIVVLDGREATIATVRGTQIQIHKKVISHAHAKIKVGGQSARRYERLIEESIEYFYKKVGETMDEYYVGKIKGVVIGGPGPTKDFFLKMKPFNYQIQVLGVVDTGYTEEYGIREALAKSGGILEAQEAVAEKEIIDKFIREVVKDGLATYGEKQVRETIETRQAEKVLLSEGIEYKKYVYETPQGARIEKVSKTPLQDTFQTENGETARLKETISLFDELMDLAHQNEVPVEIISTETSEGSQFLNGFAGIGAFLKYKTRY